MNENTTSNDVWYYASEGTTFGPFNRAELQQKAAQGSITPETLIVPQGQEEWRAYGTVFPGVPSLENRDVIPVKSAAEKKPLSKRDKVLGYGCLLPLMVCGVLAFLSDLIKSKGDEQADEIEAMLANDIDDNTPPPYTIEEAKYIVFMGQKMHGEAVTLMADESWEPPTSAFAPNPVKSWKGRVKGLHDEIFSVYGHKALLRNEGTVRHLVVEAYQSMVHAMSYYEELVAARTREAEEAARDLMRTELETSREFLMRAEQALRDGDI